MAELTDASIWDSSGQNRIALIGLNGHGGQSSDPLEIKQRTTISSFAIYEGDRTQLIDAWSGRKIMLMRRGEVESQVRVAAYPAGKAEFGLLEII